MKAKTFNLNKHHLKASTLALITMILFASCQKTNFTDIAPLQKATEVIPPPDIPVDPIVTPPPTPPPPVDPPPPVIPPVVEPPKPKPQPLISSGACAGDSSTTLTSCQKCLVPLNPPAPPQFSKKGQALISIMAAGCAVPNKSAPTGYTPPTYEQLVKRLNRLSPVFYPDTTMTAQQENAINLLLNNNEIINKTFGGLWYQPPVTDAFETYFGLEVKEAVYQLCYQSTSATFTPTNTTPLMSKKYMDCMFSSHSASCKESADYVQANVYRDQLRNAMVQSIKNPYVAPPPTPAKSCTWEKFDGLYELGGDAQIAKWLVSGAKVSMEVKGVAGRCSAVTAIPTGSDVPPADVVISAYICK